MRESWLLLVALACVQSYAADAPLLKSTRFEPLAGRTLDLTPGMLREVVVHKTTAAPVIDGKLDDSCWARIPAQTGFVFTKSSVRSRAYRRFPGLEEQQWAGQLKLKTNERGEWLARQQTEVKLIYDDRALYLGFICHESKVDRIITIETERDGKVWADDCVEIFIDVDRQGKTYRQFLLSAASVQRDSLGRNAGWDGPWEAKAALGAKAWTAEFRIPFETLGVDKVAPGANWKVNFAREEQPHSELSSWSMVLKRFSERTAMGNLFFDEKCPVSFTGLTTPRPGVGENRLLVSIGNVGPTAAAVTVQHTLRSDGKQVAHKSLSVTVPARAAKQVAVDYAIGEPGEYDSTVEVLDENGGSVFDRLSQTLKVDAAILQVHVPQPDYLLGDRTAVAEFDLSVGELSLKDVSVTCTLTDASGRTLRSCTIQSPSGQTGVLRLDISGLTEGAYTVCTELTGAKPFNGSTETGFSKMKGFFD